MTVEEYFSTEKIQRGDVEGCLEIAEADAEDYQVNALNFLLEVWTIQFKDLSFKQQAWLSHILENMAEARIERKGYFSI